MADGPLPAMTQEHRERRQKTARAQGFYDFGERKLFCV